MTVTLKTAPFPLGNHIRIFVWRVAYYSEPKLNPLALLPNVTFRRRRGVGGGRRVLAYIYNKECVKSIILSDRQHQQLLKRYKVLRLCLAGRALFVFLKEKKKKKETAGLPQPESKRTTHS